MLLVVVAAIPAMAGDAPAVPSAGAIKPAPAPGHRFFDRQNTVSIAVLAGAYVADGITTRQILGTSRAALRPREQNPIARPFVRSDAGTAAYFAGSLGVSIAARWWLHRRGHHRMERVLGWAGLGVEGWALAQNSYSKQRWGL